MQNGYAGKFLQVDLTGGVFSCFTIEEERLKNFIGGSSLAASLYLERYNLQADPLSAENPLDGYERPHGRQRVCREFPFCYGL